MSEDFRSVYSSVDFRNQKPKAFIYADPPYLGTTNNYSNSFTAQDTVDLFEILMQSGIRFAVSEFDHPLVLDLADQHGLIVNDLGERRTIGNRRRELLITNYRPVQQVSMF